LIVEVLSESTEAYDRGDKFARYRKLESLREYVLVAQDRVRVESFSKRGGEWVLTEWSGIEEVVRLESVGCEVAMREIYAKTKWGVEQGEQRRNLEG
ncbi:MAG TPA: Uma2 family endonuclease, partial [Isosphaeraceae bacterium]|nr:Uma2 family endonuclease [Isosphaeraceae bacterium]